MNEASKKIWQKIEDNIGHCILYKDAAMKEVLGEESFVLQFATLSAPEKVEVFLGNAENIKVTRNEPGNYIFVMNGTKVEIQCIDPNAGLKKAYEEMFNRVFRCENLGINMLGQYNKNIDAYKDILDKKLHFASSDATLTEFLVGKIVRYVFVYGFTVGDDILDYIKDNNVFKNKTMLSRFLGAFVDSLRKNRCTWDKAVEALKVIESVLPSKDFIKYTAKLNEENRNDKFIRNYLYNLFISLKMTAHELQKIIPNEPTLQYFDSLALNASASLGIYQIFTEIKENYGAEFLELLSDVQENIMMSLGMEYIRYTEESFDISDEFFNDSRFWCSFDELSNPAKVIEDKSESESKADDETMDVSKGNVNTWTAETYDENMYPEEGETSKEKRYLDDDDVEDKNDTGLNMAEIDSYEEGLVEDERVHAVDPKTNAVKNDEIMNSQRGHESKVLNSGGV